MRSGIEAVLGLNNCERAQDTDGLFILAKGFAGLYILKEVRGTGCLHDVGQRRNRVGDSKMHSLHEESVFEESY